MRRIVSILFLLLPAATLAQGTSTGETHLEFLYPARILSMGEAPVADPVHSTSLFANPACLASSGSPEVMFSQVQWIQDIQTQLLSTSIPLLSGTAALALSSTNVGDIEVRDVPGPALGTFSAHFTSLQLGYAAPLVQDLQVGVMAKYLYDKLYVDDASGFAFDLGALYKLPYDGLTAGISVSNVGKMARLRAQSADLPTKSSLGVNYQLQENDFQFTGDLALSRDIVPGTNALHAGAEATYDSLFSVRLGYQTGYDIRGISAGLGIRYSILVLDYAFVPFSQGFGDAHIITLSIHL